MHKMIFRVSLALILIAALVPAAHADWVGFTDPGHGARVTYPDHIFTPLKREAGSIEQRFVAGGGEAHMAVGSWRNQGRDSLREIRAKLLDDAVKRSLTYDPGGRSWFVISGYQGTDIYYHKVMFSCGGRVVSAFGLTYPTAKRALYDPIVERMEDSFRPGREC